MAFKKTEVSIAVDGKLFFFVRKDDLGDLVSIRNEDGKELFYVDFSELIKIVEKLDSKFENNF